MRTRRRMQQAAPAEAPEAPAAPDSGTTIGTIAPDDPILAYFQSAPGPVEIDKLKLDSPALETLRQAGVKLAVPLVSQGELIGVLNLGPRLSEQEYSADDRKLLDNLASQAAPALRVAQLVREQEAEARRRERYENELRIANLIQHNFLPRELPELPGWTFGAFYQSMREVGGDFYDFIPLPYGGVGIVIGDVTDKGVPAALVMASTRSIIRSVAQRVAQPGKVLEEVNEHLCPEMPPKMFVTCLYAVLEPHSGKMVYANAGHNLPYLKRTDCIDELRARGMPLGLLPGSSYEENEVTIGAGETVLFTTDGIAEAHDSSGEMFGCPRIIEVMSEFRHGHDLHDVLLQNLNAFTGPAWEQEDDITMVTLDRMPHEQADFERTADATPTTVTRLADLQIPSEPGNERTAMQQVADVVAGLDLPPTRLEKLKTAVAEATMNAIEHGNQNNPEVNVHITVEATSDDLTIRIVDHGGGRDITESTAPDLEKKLAGEQTPRGWGLFLIKNMVDEMKVSSDETHHTIELVMHLGATPEQSGGGSGGAPASSGGEDGI
jgi:serine phosphatase RsbU (regulator of sigma subunit)/anti-sigma regulatory factor (Ser/Thr protein kinase)